MKRDEPFYNAITRQIIEALEAGVKPWRCPWDRSRSGRALPWNVRSGHDYRGINIVILWMAAQHKGYATPAWLTLKQANELGGRVRKGEKSTVCCFYKLRDVEREVEDPDTGERHKDTRTVPLLRLFHVFNVDQVEGIHLDLDTPAAVPFTPIEAAEELLAKSGAVIREGGAAARYSPSQDVIYLPERSRFKRAEDFYATATHELVHWTGHPTRLARDFSSRYGDQAYAFEELVAELGSAYLDAELRLEGDLQHASYLASWLKILRNDPRAVLRAATLASRAHQYLMLDLWKDAYQQDAA